MSIINAGKCTNCGAPFYRSFGHPNWFSVEATHPIVQWQIKNSKLCDNCAEKFPEISGEDNPIMVTGFGLKGKGTNTEKIKETLI